MSGICAIWDKYRPHGVANTLAAMTAAASLTPAEASETHRLEGIGLGISCRFPDSQQMLRNSRLVLACDAELLNEEELRETLTLPPADAGVAGLLAALYDRHGDAFVTRLRGSFSVIVWDESERRLLAAVDGFGIKRLAWYDDGRALLIASRATAIHAGAPALGINPRAIARILNFSASLGPETIFTGVHRLGAGMALHASERETRTVRYWDMRYDAHADGDEGRLARELEAVVERSVSAHSGGVAQSHLGAFLSGGTDSSTILGMMTRALGAPVKAFSIGFEEQPFNELQYAETAAHAYRADHKTYFVSARDCERVLPDIVRSFDEPFGNASAVATYFCAWLAASNGADTLLAGDGGDELFGGNERYATERMFEIYHRVPGWMRNGLIEPTLGSPLKAVIPRKVRGYIRRAKLPGVERMFSFAFLRSHSPDEVFTADFVRSLNEFDVLDVPTQHYLNAPADDHLDRLLYVDMKITLADNDLPKVTCVSELAGVRTRFPFLDREVAEFSGRIPPRLKVNGLEKRYLFKKAFARLLPSEIIRKKKHGFGIPVATWMKSDPKIRELTRDTLLSARAEHRGYFRRSFLEELFRKHEATDSPYYGDTLWAFLMVELWHRQFVDEPSAVSLQRQEAHS
jgi:asparagine synthase (glutamine-hydrolysing)